MQSRKDQVQAYFFVVGRLAAAVTHGRPDVLQPPNKRTNSGVVLGFMLAAVLAGIFGVYGLFVPGGDNTWRSQGAIVMDESTGARYVYLDGQLRPVLNYSSARLASGNAGGGSVISVSRNSLKDAPIGQPIGIPGAPDALPDSGKLAGSAWTECVQPDGTVTLLLGGEAGKPHVPAAQGMLVATPDGGVYLVWQGKRYRVGERTVLETLGYGAARPVSVVSSWLNPILSGPDITLPRVPGAGAPGPVIDGRPSRVGQVYKIHNAALGFDQLYLVGSDGVSSLSRTGAALVLAGPAAKDAYGDAEVRPIEAGPGALSGVPVSTGPDFAAGLPADPPRIVTPTQADSPCVSFVPSEHGEMSATVEFRSASQVAAMSVPAAAHRAGETADRVGVPAGAGVLAKELSAPGAAPGTLYLVTEVGTRFPLADAGVAGALGYSASSAVQVPRELLDLLPAGPVLSTSGAVQPQSPQIVKTSGS
ncbi:type VII secretion protein EccB [Amycolatopsis sp. lyj-109]|uniref:type VII secretion protein EccB n=1 Tax=Amycolatopsis sp. lyj-109 TaxID=2789287 RepID=UPI003979EEB3